MKDLDLCPGTDCPLRMTCERYTQWLSLEPDEESYHWEITTPYWDGHCELYIPMKYYGD